MEPSLVMGFSDKDLVSTAQLHVDTLVVTVCIRGFNVHKVVVDRGSGAEIMYPNLFRGLGLKEKDLESYGAPLMGFDGKMVILKGKIKLPVQVEKEKVLVDFIMVDVYSPYTTILIRPWLHALRAISSTLQQNVNFSTKGRTERYEDAKPR